MLERFGITPSEQNTDLLQTIGKTVSGFLSNVFNRFNSMLESLVNGSSSFLVSGFTKVISVTFQVLLIFIASAYFLYDYHKFTANFERYVPLRWRSFYHDLTIKADKAVGGYLRGQLLITLILGVLIWIGLSIVGIPLALAISFLAAIFNMVPYLHHHRGYPRYSLGF
ncbi:MAG: AI-2E family transporter [Deinococcales bacterium]